jgi:hypothetical protein
MGAIVFLRGLVMTTQATLIEIAKQGDASAIAALMNDALSDQDVWVKAVLEDDCLQVMLRSSKPLNRSITVAFLHRGFLRLQAESIRRIRAYAWQTYADFPDWIAEFTIPPLIQLVTDQPGAIVPISTIAPANQSKLAVSPAKLTISSKSSVVKVGFVVIMAVVLYFVVI